MVGALVGGIVAMLVVTVGWGWPGGVCAAIPFALLGFMCGFAFIKDRN
jgi:hypothetical protein